MPEQIQQIVKKCALFTGLQLDEQKELLVNGRWQSVGQGRQWVDENGRHVLIMLPSDEVRELVLQPRTLRWALVQVGGGKRTAV